MKITDSDLVAQRIAINGSGWFLGVSPTGEVIVQEIGPNKEENPLIALREGWIDCFITGEEGLEVLDVSTPVFNPQMEELVNEDPIGVPDAFWHEYGKLR